MLDDDVHADRDRPVRAGELDATAPEQPPEPRGRHADHAVALGCGQPDDLRERVLGDRDPTEIGRCKREVHGARLDPSQRARVTPDYLDLLDLAGLQAARADVGTLRRPADDDADALEVGIETPLRGDHRMAPVIAEPGLLPADGTDLWHGREW